MSDAALSAVALAAAAATALTIQATIPRVFVALQATAAATEAQGPPTGPAPVAATPAARPSPSPTAVASYRIRARLDAPAHVITGEATVRWRNTASVPTSELWLHAYLEAFAHERTLFLRESARRHRGGSLSTPGGLVVHAVSAPELGGGDLWPLHDRHSPGDPDDTTDLRLPLPQSVAPGASLTLTIPFTARLPGLVERTGFARDFIFAAQWFPKLARLEADGVWAHFAFHPQAEFYADFGDYDVALDVPREMIVGATGVRVEDRVEGDRRHLRFLASGVHDFAWTAWPRFVEHREAIAGVEVSVLRPPGNGVASARALDALRRALPRFSELYGPYPYPTLTVVHPPRFAAAAGGMEYPTLITTGGPWFLGFGTRAIEAVTVHELAHQWFYGLLASNEHALPVLDEGLATYAEGRVLAEAYGTGSALSLWGFDLSMDALQRAHAAAHARDDVVVQPAPAFTSYSSIGALVYAKTAVTLDTLGRTYGGAGLDRALARYAREQRFAHPTFGDLTQAIEQELGPAAARALVASLAEPGWVNFSAEAPRCHRRQGSPSPEAGPASDPPSVETCRAVLRREGTLVLPVDVELSFEDGSRQRERWDGEHPTRVLYRDGPPRLVAVHLDPDRRVPLDSNRLDDAAASERRRPLRAFAWLGFTSGLALGWLGP